MPRIIEHGGVGIGGVAGELRDRLIHVSFRGVELQRHLEANRPERPADVSRVIDRVLERRGILVMRIADNQRDALVRERRRMLRQNRNADDQQQKNQLTMALHETPPSGKRIVKHRIVFNSGKPTLSVKLFTVEFAAFPGHWQ